MPVDGKPTLLVNTMSADGVRYAAGFVVWWTKGWNGDLYDSRVDAGKPVLAGCRSG
jgi:membrane-bound inhibitor of C-type lysozyme